jgi:hypothetical protein
LFNFSIITSIFPSALKTALFLPFQPISILPALSKGLERLICDVLFGRILGPRTQSAGSSANIIRMFINVLGDHIRNCKFVHLYADDLQIYAIWMGWEQKQDSGYRLHDTRADRGQKASAAIGFIKATGSHHIKKASISLKMYLKRLAILEKASISLKKSLQIIEIFKKAPNF